MLTRFVRRSPTWAACSLYAVATVLAFFPLLLGKVLLPPGSDQTNGYPPRQFAAEYFHKFGSIPQWTPYLFGGMPYAANTAHGDTFFPTALLRLALPVDVGMALGFPIFVFLAGVFMYLFLRALRLDWGAAFVGGAAYMFTGMVLAQASPGHDGKLFVSAILPLSLLFLHRAAVRRDWREYVYFGTAVGFALLSPHFQLTYYLLMAAGFFWLFLTFVSDEKPVGVPWWRSAALFLAGLVVGFAIGAIQLLPFVDYTPLSARGSTPTWEYATSFALPPIEITNFIWPSFVGYLGQYWGPNGIKLDTQYLGASVVMLALLAFRLRTHRKVGWFFGFLFLYALLFALGGSTPFYYIPYTLLPGIKMTRAAEAIFVLGSLSAAALAAFGTQTLLAPVPTGEPGAAKERAKKGVAADDRAPRTIAGIEAPLVAGLAVLVICALLAGSGALRSITENLAGQGASTADENYPTLVFDSVRVLLAGIALVALALPRVRRQWEPEVWATAVGIVVLAELWSGERDFLRFSPRAAQTFAADGVVHTLQSDSSLFRVLVPAPGTAYDGNYLMANRVRTAMGYSGNEMGWWDTLLGGKNIDSNITKPRLWDLTGVKYLLLPGKLPSEALQQLHLEPVGDTLSSWDGRPAFVYRITDAVPYALLVPHAWKVSAGADTVVSTLLESTQLNPRSLVLLAGDAPFGPTTQPTPADLLERIDTPVSARQEREGHLVFDFASPAPRDAYLYVAESYHPYWQATVDGQSAPVGRAQWAMMAVPIKGGAKHVELQYVAKDYPRARLISVLAGVFVVAVAVVGTVNRRRRASARSA